MSGIPGTFTTTPPEPVEAPLIAREPGALRGALLPSLPRRFRLGDCIVFVGREPADPSGVLLWHLSISHPKRYPSWDEIKLARYRLTPADVTMALLLPPPAEYVNLPEGENVFHLWEVEGEATPE